MQAYTRDGKVAMSDTADVMIHEEPTGFMYAGNKGRASGKKWFFGPWRTSGPNDGYTMLFVGN